MKISCVMRHSVVLLSGTFVEVETPGGEGLEVLPPRVHGVAVIRALNVGIGGGGRL